ncbi:MAG: sigma 54-interacting transcriptional regulator [Betaproteobacteria bacterium]|nr:sigma 54-interacting transcriptional regulator [Betaproteobacteria bacterium]
MFVSSAMREVQTLIDAVGPTDTTVLILGESGTGKELVAQAIRPKPAPSASWLPSMAVVYRKTSSSPNCSVMSAAHLPVPIA